MTEVYQTRTKHLEKIEIVKRKCFSVSSRIKIFYALETFKEMCVCGLAKILTTNRTTASYLFASF